ncbi:uncharacterized protein RCC_04321 [Ramularia collo-cygni]|uniref:Uncharacterized protein n=1 Tax=Ramularia collo-cygni TaxID=112498 RepID=A0A2D3V4M0_9PEZI|nr:uncharacterized protein RCC_04321 [Ramularia collo-cygni]CZT18476.1 uncharacterized protein RCC_04321 [Ramularia collo-cygni]
MGGNGPSNEPGGAEVYKAKLHVKPACEQNIHHPSDFKSPKHQHIDIELEDLPSSPSPPYHSAPRATVLPIGTTRSTALPLNSTFRPQHPGHDIADTNQSAHLDLI